MRKTVVPQSETLTYLLGDHLGSTSLAVDASDTDFSDMVETRYKPWGEVRFATPSKTLPTRYTYTGQYSHVSDEATDLGSAGFGLLFYNARWYDPSLGRFAQADTIVPGGVQGLDRYAYVSNSPINYIDPSGHRCYPENECVGPNGQGEPDDVDYSKLDDYVYKGTGVSGQIMFTFYIQVWEENGGYLTIKEFVEMIMSHEFEPYQNSDGTLNFVPGSNYNEDLLKTTTANWYWSLHMRETTVTSEGALNWIASFGSAGMAYRAGSLTRTKASGLAHDVITYVYNLHGIQRNDPTAPSTFGNLSMFPSEQLRTASQGYENNQYIGVWPNQNDANPAYILSACQVAYQNNEKEYLNEQCKRK